MIKVDEGETLYVIPGLIDSFTLKRNSFSPHVSSRAIIAYICTQIWQFTLHLILAESPANVRDSQIHTARDIQRNEHERTIKVYSIAFISIQKIDFEA